MTDPSLFIFHCATDVLTLLFYVDDMLLTGSPATLVSLFLETLSKEFSIKDLGLVHHFLGIEITSTVDGLHLSQTHYTLDILEKSQMSHCQPMPTPLEAKLQLVTNGTPLAYPSFFQSIIGALQYLTLTRPDLSFSVNFVS